MVFAGQFVLAGQLKTAARKYAQARNCSKPRRAGGKFFLGGRSRMGRVTAPAPGTPLRAATRKGEDIRLSFIESPGESVSHAGRNAVKAKRAGVSNGRQQDPEVRCGGGAKKG